MNLGLTDSQRRLQAVASAFARDEVRPRSLELDAEPDPNRIYPADLLASASRLGLRLLTLPRSLGGQEADVLTEAVVLEEIATGDAGFATTLAHPWREGRILAELASERARAELLPELVRDPTYSTSLGMTEEHAGSDIMLPFTGTTEAGPRTEAVRVAGGWRITGRKRWITNGRDSKLIVLLARTDPAVPWREGVTVFLVPRSLPGVVAGVVENKTGLRANQNAEIILDGVEVGDHYRVGEVGRGTEVLAPFSVGSKVKESARAVGIARASLDEAVAWASRRVQGGRPIIAHQSIHATLAQHSAEVEAARSLLWRAAWAADHDREAAGRLGDQARIVSAGVALRAAEAAQEVHGAYGVQRGRVVEKLVRDALMMAHVSGGLHAYRARLGAAIAEAGLAAARDRAPEAG